MPSEITVSVIIPFLNGSQFLREAIESVVGQSYHRWELALVDDGSTDGSSELAKNYVERFPGKVRYLEHEGHRNCGTCVSRNLGIRQTTGEFIAPLDADDVWLPNKLERQVAIMLANPEAGMVCGRSQLWYSWAQAENSQSDSLYGLATRSNSVINPPTLLRLSLERKSGTPCPSDILLRREVVERIGGFEEDFRGIYQHCEDQAFLYKVYLATPVFMSSEYWDKYRIHPESCSSLLKKSGKGDLVWLFFLNWLEKYLATKGVEDAGIWNALQKEFWPYRHRTLSYLLGKVQYRLGQARSRLELFRRRLKLVS